MGKQNGILLLKSRAEQITGGISSAGDGVGTFATGGQINRKNKNMTCLHSIIAFLTGDILSIAVKQKNNKKYLAKT